MENASRPCPELVRANDRSLLRGLPAIVLATLVGLLALTADAAAQNGTVSGTVSESSDGTPMPGVNVWFYTPVGGIAAITTSASDGTYEASLAPGTYFARTFLASPSQYLNRLYDGISCAETCVATTGTPIVVSAGNSVANIDFELDRSGAISGTVIDAATLAPLAAVTVQATSIAGKFMGSGLTAADGTFTVQRLPAGTYQARVADVSPQNYLLERFNDVACGWTCPPTGGTPIAVVAGATTPGIDFALAPGGAISGVVTDTDSGNPLGGVAVWVYTSAGTYLRSTSTSGSGTYLMGGLLSGTYYLRIAPQGPASHLSEFYDNVPCTTICDPAIGNPVVVTVGSTTGNINFALGLGGSITGTVAQAGTGTPIEDVSLGIYSSAGTLIRSVFTNSSGGYASGPLAPGTYFARTHQDGNQNYLKETFNNIACATDCLVTAGTPIVVLDDQVRSGVDFSLTLGGTVSGTITDASNGSPLASATVTIYTYDGSFVRNTASDGSGVYAVGGLATGSYFATASHWNGYASSLHTGLPCVGDCAVTGGTPIAVSAGTTTGAVDFALSPGGSVNGTVRAQGTNLPLSGASVRVYSSAGTFIGSASTSGSGTYSVTGLASGSYFVRASTPGGQYVDVLFEGIPCSVLWSSTPPSSEGCQVTSGTPVTVTAGAARSNIDFTLALGGSVSGTVTDAATGTPLAGASVGAYDAAGKLVNGATANSAGAYIVSALPTGSYFVRTEVPATANLVDVLHAAVPCSGCDVTTGTPVPVTAGATTTSIDFALAAGGSISGQVYGETHGFAGNGAVVGVFRADGGLVKKATAGSTGIYTVTGLATGAYFARTMNYGGMGIDEVFSDLPCLATCDPTMGTPIGVTVGSTTSGIDFVLSTGGSVTGVVSDASTGSPVAGAEVKLYSSTGSLARSAETTTFGQFTMAGLPSGTYYARTFSKGRYIDEIHDGQAVCFPDCLVSSGTPIVVTAGASATVDFALEPNTELIRNGDFSFGSAHWLLFATPGMEYLSYTFDLGRLQFSRRPPPPGTANQAVVFQNTGAAVPADTALIAGFDLANTSSVRKRISALVHDGDFTDLSVCTFWLPPNLPSTRYGIRTRNTKAWTDATISFYAASTNVPAGHYELDNVSLQVAPFTMIERTDCLDPVTAVPAGGTAGPDLLINGDFDSSSLAPGWGTFGQITGQVTGGVFEFIKLAGTPAGVVLQNTGEAMTTGQILTSTFQLGNSSGVRKRVTVIIHDNDFSDLSACTFWLDPGQALSTYTYRTFTTKAWTNATLSVYPATVGADQWIRLDNVTFQRTPGTATVGTECIEPVGAGDEPLVGASSDGRTADTLPGLMATGGDAEGSSSGGDVSPALEAWLSHWVVDGFRPVGDWLAGPSWLATASDTRLDTLRPLERLDLTHAVSASVRFSSTLRADAGATALVQVSHDGTTWETVHLVAPSTTATDVDVDLSAYRGTAVFVRFALDGVAPADGVTADTWRLDDIGLDVVVDVQARRR